MAGNDVLSEGEIDALMDTVADDAGAATGAAGYRSFDFTSRDRSVLGQFVTLNTIVDRQADFLLLAFDDLFSLEFNISAQAPDILSYGDIMMALSATAGTTTLEIAPIAGLSHIVFEPDLLSFLVNQFFGGARSQPPEVRNRTSLTPSEMRIAERVSELVLETMVRAWSDKLALEPAERVHAMYPDRIAAEPVSDKALRLAFDVSAGEWTSTIQVIIPFAGLERHKQHFAPPRRAREEADSVSSWEPYFRRELPRVAVELSGVFATRSIPLAQLLELQVGAVIPLHSPGDAMLCVEGEPFASGEYGSHDGNKAIKIRTLVARAASAKNGG